MCPIHIALATWHANSKWYTPNDVSFQMRQELWSAFGSRETTSALCGMLSRMRRCTDSLFLGCGVVRWSSSRRTTGLEETNHYWWKIILFGCQIRYIPCGRFHWLYEGYR